MPGDQLAKAIRDAVDAAMEEKEKEFDDRVRVVDGKLTQQERVADGRLNELADQVNNTRNKVRGMEGELKAICEKQGEDGGGEPTDVAIREEAPPTVPEVTELPPQVADTVEGFNQLMKTWKQIQPVAVLTLLALIAAIVWLLANAV